MFVAQQGTMRGEFTISTTDAEGVGDKVVSIYTQGIHPDAVLADRLARLVCLSLNLEGGIDRALELLRAETVRQRA